MTRLGLAAVLIGLMAACTPPEPPAPPEDTPPEPVPLSVPLATG